MKNVNLKKVTFANHRKISNHVSNQSQFSKGGPCIDVVQVLDDFGVWNRKWPYILNITTHPKNNAAFAYLYKTEPR